jgi:hypothetical protein
MKVNRRPFRFVLAATVALASLVGVELIARSIDGYSLTSWHLTRVPMPTAPLDAATTTHALQIPVAPGVDRAWFLDDPLNASGGNSSSDAELARRYWSHPGLEFSGVYEWNLEFLRRAACEGDSPRRRNVVSTVFPVGDLFVFEPLAGAPYPRYRFLRNARYPSGITTNAFGWRGPDISLNKPEKTIRIAFAGASTTAAPHSDKYSYPDYIRAWLDRWTAARSLSARFEVINAAREGIDSTSIAAIVRDELTPVEPDLVVYYEGANQFGLADYIVWPRGIIPAKPSHTGPWLLESESALVRRLRTVRDPFTVRRGEPQKPRLGVAWPPDLNERDPQLDHPRLTLDLPTIMRDLDAMRGALSSHGGRLVVSSFVWCVWDGMQLDPTSEAGVYQYLNEMFWPFSYAYMRRLADFQNRVFEKYARTRGIPFIDVARQYPRDPRLFLDGVHMTQAGTKLMAWISFQQLVPILERAIASGALPQASRGHLTEHPAFAGEPRLHKSASSILASCAGA